MISKKLSKRPVADLAIAFLVVSFAFYWYTCDVIAGLETSQPKESKGRVAVFTVTLVTKETTPPPKGDDYETKITETRYRLIREIREVQKNLPIIRYQIEDARMVTGPSILELDARGRALRAENVPDGLKVLLVQVPFLLPPIPLRKGTVEDEVNFEPVGPVPAMKMKRRLTTTRGADGAFSAKIWLEGKVNLTVNGQACEIYCDGRGASIFESGTNDLATASLRVRTSVGSQGVLLFECDRMFTVTKVPD